MDNQIRWFYDVFGVSMTQVGKELGVSRESVSQIFRKKSVSRSLGDKIVEKLTELRDANYQADKQMAEYRYTRATAAIDKIIEIRDRERRV